jgi:glycine cleavage system regulatory protein
MTILGSEFAVLLLLSGQGADVERRLAAACKRLEWEKRLTVFFRPLESGVVPTGEAPGRALDCVVTGVDKAGIVARIARALADHRVNVEDLHTDLRQEPESGTPIYTMRIRMRIPPWRRRARPARTARAGCRESLRRPGDQGARRPRVSAPTTGSTTAHVVRRA